MKAQLSTLVLLTSMALHAEVGSFSVPVGSSSASPAFPGKSYEFEVTARPGQRLNFTSMYGASNDWFFSSKDGIKLQHAGTSDITGMIQVYDAGSEVDQNPADAPDTAGNQTAPNTGLADPVNAVRCLSQYDGLEAKNFIKATSEYLGENHFKITLFVKEKSPTPLSPGVFWVTGDNGYRPFVLNKTRLNNGLEAQAEDGNPATLLQTVRGQVH